MVPLFRASPILALVQACWTMKETDSENLAPMVFFPTLRNVVSEKEQRGSRVISVLAQRAASEGPRWTRAVETTQPPRMH